MIQSGFLSEDDRKALTALARDASSPCRATRCANALERFPIRWNHLIEKESLNFKELEHVLIEKVE